MTEKLFKRTYSRKSSIHLSAFQRYICTILLWFESNKIVTDILSADRIGPFYSTIFKIRKDLDAMWMFLTSWQTFSNVNLNNLYIAFASLDNCPVQIGINDNESLMRFSKF